MTKLIYCGPETIIFDRDFGSAHRYSNSGGKPFPGRSSPTPTSVMISQISLTSLKKSTAVGNAKDKWNEVQLIGCRTI